MPCSSRRNFLKSLGAGAAWLALSPPTRAAVPVAGGPRPLLGAIRWDAWHGDRGLPGREVEQSLGPQKYHWRLPFFAKVISDHEVKIDGTAQAVMDREIELARRAGLDYWAFVIYDSTDPMSLGLERYLASQKKAGLRFCGIVYPGHLIASKKPGEGLDRLLKLAAQPDWLKVMGNRPLLYVGFIDDKWLKALGGERGAREAFDAARSRFRQAGLGDPYIVIMDFKAEQAHKLAVMLGADAVSAYATEGGGKGDPFASLAAHAERFWEACRSSGAQVVPIAMSGWDRRPRIERPVWWERSWQKPGAGIEKFYVAPRPEELAAHVKSAMTWVEKNPQACPARAVLIYAWNENDEGGWLVPTLTADGAIDDGRVQALGEMTGAWKR